MSDRDGLVTPLVVESSATLGSLAHLVSLAKAAVWVLVRSTVGFDVVWNLLHIEDIRMATDEPADPKARLSEARVLEERNRVRTIPLSAWSESTSGPVVILAGTRVFGLVPPKLATAPSATRSIGARDLPPPPPARARSAPLSPQPVGAAPAGLAEALRIDASAFVHSPQKVLQGETFTLEVGLAATPVAGVEAGAVRIDFQPGESAVNLDIRVECEGFNSANGFSQTLSIPRDDPFTPRVKLSLTTAALPDGIDEVLRVIHISYACRGLTCGTAAWRVLVQRTATQVPVPRAAPPRVAINTSAPPIDLTLQCVWQDDNEASHTLRWSYSTPHTIAAPTKKMVRSSAELATLPLGIVDEMAQADGRDDVELTMGGVAARIAAEVPSGVWEVLRAITTAVKAARGDAAVPTLLLLTQETRVPWELALLPDEPGSDGTGPLRLIGTEFIVSRWVLDDDNLPPLPPHEIRSHDIVAVFGDYAGTMVAELPFAKQEAEWLRQRHGIPIPASRANLVKLLNDQQQDDAGERLTPGILHFAGHGEAARPNTPSSFIVLNDGSNMSSTAFLNAPLLKKNAPLVFLNACQLGAGTSSLGQPGGFAVVFVRARCSAVIAPLWSVNDQVAHDIATHFYENTLGLDTGPRKSVAEAMREARLARFTDVQVPDRDGATTTRRTSTPLAYLVYGHPALHL